MSGKSGKSDEDLRSSAAEYRSAHAPEPGNAANAAPHESNPATSTPKKSVRSLDQWATAASEAIEDAMRQGAFDNLRGKGKPLELGKDAFTPAESALAYDILKNNDLTPGWMQQRNEIVREIEKWRATVGAIVAEANLAHARAGTPDARAAFGSRWRAQYRTLQSQVELFNRRIGTINLQLPTPRMEVFKLRLHEELQKAGATFDTLQ